MCKFVYIVRIGEMTAGSCQPLSILYHRLYIIIATALAPHHACVLCQRLSRQRLYFMQLLL